MVILRLRILILLIGTQAEMLTFLQELLNLEETKPSSLFPQAQQVAYINMYIFVLAMVFLGAYLAHMAGLEPIIGAFLSGLALQPPRSPAPRP